MEKADVLGSTLKMPPPSGKSGHSVFLTVVEALHPKFFRNRENTEFDECWLGGTINVQGPVEAERTRIEKAIFLHCAKTLSLFRPTPVQITSLNENIHFCSVHCTSDRMCNKMSLIPAFTEKCLCWAHPTFEPGIFAGPFTPLTRRGSSKCGYKPSFGFWIINLSLVGSERCGIVVDIFERPEFNATNVGLARGHTEVGISPYIGEFFGHPGNDLFR